MAWLDHSMPTKTPGGQADRKKDREGLPQGCSIRVLWMTGKMGQKSFPFRRRPRHSPAQALRQGGPAPPTWRFQPRTGVPLAGEDLRSKATAQEISRRLEAQMPVVKVRESSGRVQDLLPYPGLREALSQRAPPGFFRHPFLWGLSRWLFTELLGSFKQACRGRHLASMLDKKFPWLPWPTPKSLVGSACFWLGRF
jgi:hypothetical protein